MQPSAKGCIVARLVAELKLASSDWQQEAGAQPARNRCSLPCNTFSLQHAALQAVIRKP